MSQLCTVLSKANARGLISTYPCLGISQLIRPKTDIEPFNFEELEHLLSTIKKTDIEFHDLVKLWGRIGLRTGEMIALKWSDLDTFNNVLTIGRTRGSITSQDGPPKTETSERDISLRPAALKILGRQKARTDLMDEYIWTFKNNQYSRKAMCRRFKHFLQLSGLR